ncbi:MAG: dTMP kinase [Fusobacteriaceae bacterium]
MQKIQKRFISIEGCDGSGKTTILNRLKKDFPEFFFTREPGGTKLTEGVRELILENPNAPTETLISLFAVSRLDNTLINVIPALRDGKVVISDRWGLSCYAYQLTRNGETKTLEFIKRLESANKSIYTDAVPDPYYIFLDLDPEIGLARKKDNGQELNKFDELSLEFHKETRASYVHWLKSGEFGLIQMYADIQNGDEITYSGVVIDASQDQDTVYEAVVKVIKAIIS